MLPFTYSLEAVIDDLLVLAFLVGNDLLPHVPLLQIESKGLDNLFAVRRKHSPTQELLARGRFRVQSGSQSGSWIGSQSGSQIESRIGSQIGS